MLIGCKNKAQTRTYTVAGRQWVFTRKAAHQPLQCPVEDSVAIEIFLSPANANLFYALDVKPATLTRAAPVEPAVQAETPAMEAVSPDIPAAMELLGHSVRELREVIPTVADAGLLRSAIEIEAAKTDPRSSIITILDARLKSLV